MTKDSVGQKLEELRREQILEAAAKVFAEKGFHAAKMQEVANVAGVSNGTVYNYYRSKDEVLIALLAQLSERERRGQQMAELEQTSDIEAMFVQQLQRRFRTLKEQKELWRAVLPELITNPGLRKQGYEQIFGPIFELGEATFGGMSKKGRLKSLGASHMVRAMAGSVLGVFVLDLLGDDKTEQEADKILALLGKAFVAAFAGSREDRGQR